MTVYGSCGMTLQIFKSSRGGSIYVVPCSISNLSSEQISKRKHEKLANHFEDQRLLKNMFSQGRYLRQQIAYGGGGGMFNGLITSHTVDYVISLWCREDKKEEIWVIKTRYHHPLGRRLFCPIAIFSFWFLCKCR